MPRATCHQLSVVGQCVLVALGLTWAIFERPAPVVSVRWNDDVSVEERQRLEEQFFLESGEQSDAAWRYQLGWPARSNIAAIVRNPRVNDTHNLDRSNLQLSADVSFGPSRVWWAGPFKGARGRSQFRYLVLVIAVVTSICAWQDRRARRS